MKLLFALCVILATATAYEISDIVSARIEVSTKRSKKYCYVTH